MNAEFSIYRAEITPRPIRLNDDEKAAFIIDLCAKHNGVDPQLVRKKGKKREVSNAKHMARYFNHYFTTLTLLSNAKKTGAIDHSSTIWSLAVVSDLIDTERDFRNTFKAIEKEVVSRFSRVEPMERRPS